MKASTGSALIVALGIAAAAACAGTRVASAQPAETGVTDSSRPGACSAAIARLEKALSESFARGRALATAPESVGAMLHHQPTQDSVATAERKSLKRVENLLTLARELRSEGKHSQCISMLAKIALPVSFH
jgi:hypothetical protein